MDLMMNNVSNTYKIFSTVNNTCIIWVVKLLSFLCKEIENFPLCIGHEKPFQEINSINSIGQCMVNYYNAWLYEKSG